MVGALPCTALVTSWPKPLERGGCNFPSAGCQWGLPSTAERRSNNLPFPPPPPFSFQRFHRILWLVAKPLLRARVLSCHGPLLLAQWLCPQLAQSRTDCTRVQLVEDPSSPLSFAVCWNAMAELSMCRSSSAGCVAPERIACSLLSFVGTWRGFTFSLLCTSLDCTLKVDLHVQALPHLLNRPVEHAQLIRY